MGAVDWSNIVPAGAFIAGAVLGSLATIRVMRWVLDYIARKDPQPKPPRK